MYQRQLHRLNLPAYSMLGSDSTLWKRCRGEGGGSYSECSYEEPSRDLLSPGHGDVYDAIGQPSQCNQARMTKDVTEALTHANFGLQIQRCRTCISRHRKTC